MNTEKAERFLELEIPIANGDPIRYLTRTEIIYLMYAFANQQKKEAFEAGAREMRQFDIDTLNIYKIERCETLLEKNIIDALIARLITPPLPEYKEDE